MPLSHRGTEWSRTILKTMVVLNIVLALAIVAAFVLSFVFERQVVAYYRSLPTGLDGALLVVGMRVFMVIGIWMFPLFHRVLTKLIAIVDTVRMGDPFVPENAERLQQIAWALFWVQMLHLVFGVMAKMLSSTNAVIEWTFSVSGWLAVILLFVLARVFEEGARMRRDLEGTV